MSFFFCLEWQCEHFRTHIISYSLLGGGGGGGGVGGWKARCSSSADVMKRWLLDPKSNTSPPVCCAAEAAVPKLFSSPPSEARPPNPTRMKVLPHMPSGAPHRANAFLRLGDPSVNQSAAEFHNLCFSAPFCFLYELTCFCESLVWTHLVPNWNPSNKFSF